MEIKGFVGIFNIHDWQISKMDAHCITENSWIFRRIVFRPHLSHGGPRPRPRQIISLPWSFRFPTDRQTDLSFVSCPFSHHRLIHVSDTCWLLGFSPTMVGVDVLRRRWPHRKWMSAKRSPPVHHYPSYSLFARQNIHLVINSHLATFESTRYISSTTESLEMRVPLIIYEFINKALKYYYIFLISFSLFCSLSPLDARGSNMFSRYDCDTCL